VRAEPGSFRDQHSRVFYDDDGQVLRALSAEGLEDWNALATSRVYARFCESGNIVSTEPAEGSGAELAGWSALLRHERVPFISYPYEWTFSMLRDAALLQLDLMLAGLEDGVILKDASPYNVQWRGAQPVFIDIGSWERARAGEPWAGYRQFCMLFLYPLLLHAYRGVPFQPWLRGSLAGIEPCDCRRLLGWHHSLRRGVFSHVVLHERLERRHGKPGENIREELRAAGFATDLIRATLLRLRKLVRRLEMRSAQSNWSVYRVSNTYSDPEEQRKAEVVRSVARAVRPKLVWDLGCNDGRYSRVASEYATYTIAMDADQATVDAFYRSLAHDDDRSVLPLVVNVADPSPALGWRNLERKTLLDRGAPELTLCLALVHHLVITGNVPMASVLQWLHGLDSVLLIEFPGPEDPMVRALLDRKRPGMHADYRVSTFEALLRELFSVEQVIPITGTRALYLAYPQR
jgi:hypothetical protein